MGSNAKSPVLLWPMFSPQPKSFWLTSNGAIKVRSFLPKVRSVLRLERRLVRVSAPGKMASAPKKRKLETSGNIPSRAVVDKVATSSHNSSIPETPIVRLNLKVQQAKKFAVTQAEQEGCLGNYRSFDSPFGNYLVPVVPTLADLIG